MQENSDVDLDFGRVSISFDFAVGGAVGYVFTALRFRFSRKRVFRSRGVVQFPVPFSGSKNYSSGECWRTNLFVRSVVAWSFLFFSHEHN